MAKFPPPRFVDTAHSSPVPAPSCCSLRTSGVGIRFGRIAGTFSLSSKSSAILRSPLLCTMSDGSQPIAFHHYTPSNRKYHILHTPPAVPPPQTGTNLPPSNTSHPSLRRIQPALTNSTPTSNTTSTSRGGSSGDKKYQFIPYSPSSAKGKS